MIRVRESRAGDADRLFAIWDGAVARTHGFLDPGDRARIAAEVRAYVAGDGFLVAVDRDDRPLGFLGGHGRHVDALFVDPGHFGQGVGSALLDAFCGDGPATVEVNEQNASGRAFYAARGFRIAARRARDDQGRPYPLLSLVRDPSA